MTNIHTVNSMISNRNRDCLECRLLSGGGLVAAGLYVCHHSKQYQKQVGKAAMYSVASGMSVRASNISRCGSILFYKRQNIAEERLHSGLKIQMLLIKYR